MRTCESLAVAVYAANPTLTNEDDIMAAAFEIAKVQMGFNRAHALFAFDEDFDGDMLDEYFHLKSTAA